MYRHSPYIAMVFAYCGVLCNIPHPTWPEKIWKFSCETTWIESYVPHNTLNGTKCFLVMALFLVFRDEEILLKCQKRHARRSEMPKFVICVCHFVTNVVYFFFSVYITGRGCIGWLNHWVHHLIDYLAHRPHSTPLAGKLNSPVNTRIEFTSKY